MYGFKLVSFPDHRKKTTSLQSTMITSLSQEVLRKILQLATNVPSAFDTSVEGSLSDKENEVSLAIDESMRCKLALCCVSKSFYALAIENLYEIVTIRSFNTVFRLARLFRVRSKVGGNLRGWYCRRLELRFAQGAQIYRGHYWDLGAKNLWGLADACPNLVILIANITRNQTYYDGPSHFTIPRMLFQTITHTCAKTLRRFEMRGDTRVGFDRVEMFLRYCPVIEVCRLNAVDSHLGSNFSYDAVDRVWEDDWSDEEPIEEFRESVKVISWPQLSDAPESLENAPLILPHLHTLEIMLGSVIRTNWSLPNLHTLGLKFYSEHDRRGDPLSLVTERLAGVLPYTQITRLSYSGTSPILWGIINSFPNLTELGFSSGNLDFFPGPRMPELLLHFSLTRIKFCPASLDALHDFIEHIKEAFTGGLLPALKSLQVYGFISDSHRRMTTYRINELNELGVKAEILGGHGGWFLHAKYTTRTRADAYAEL